jgi:hypothetical protein
MPGVPSPEISMRWPTLYLVPMALVPLLAACPTVDLGDVPPDPGQCRPSRAYFRDVIWPEIIAPADTARSCVDASGCHRREDGRSALRLTVPASGQLEQRDYDRNYDAVVPFLNCGAPEASTLLTKPLSGIDSHAGGDLLAPGSEPVLRFLEWFAQ